MPTSKTQNDPAAAILDYLSASNASRAIAQMHISGAGAVAELEAKLRRHYGMAHALCVSNASTGLLAIALALGRRRSEFITTPYTYGASLSGWLLRDNRPVFADIDPMTLTLSPESVSTVISRKTKAILGVDIFGSPCDSKALRKIADEHGLWYVADCAQSLGAFRDGRPASCDADALVVSFTTGKAVFAGEGGAVVTNNADLYQKLLWFTQHPLRQRRELGLMLSNEFALNARIHPMAAVWANAVFDDSLQRVAKQRKVWFDLTDIINTTGMTEKIDYSSKTIKPSFFRFTAAWEKKNRKRELEEEMLLHGHDIRIEPAPVTLLYRQPAFLAQYRRKIGERRASCLNAEAQVKRRFCIELTQN
ncbi:MAG: DegT/DnrJ/EryC1/StrS family aminotransferase [Pseudomonadota bacterium]